MERNPSFPFLSERTREAEEESILFSLTPTPSPQPSPKREREFTSDGLAAL